jgi:hypothetical protein
MAAEEQVNEGMEEAIEDLEAPAESQGNVAGGAEPGCGVPSMVCSEATCKYTEGNCTQMSHHILVMEQ